MAEEKVFKLRIDGVEQSISTINELESSIKTLDEKLKSTKVGSKEFKELQNQVKKSKSQLKDFELQVEGLDKEQRATALVDAFSGVAGAVGAASSAFIAFGASSESIENAEKKLLGVIGVVSGLRDASNGVIAVQKLLGNVNLKEVAKSFLVVGKTGLKSLTTLKGGVRALVGATGIGLLLVALGAVVEYWDKIAGAIGLASSEAENNVAIAQENVTAQQDALDAISGQENILKLSGKSEREILQLKIKQTDEVITALDAQLTAQQTLKEEQIKTAQRNKDILNGILTFVTAPLRLLAESIDFIVNSVSAITGVTSDLGGGIAQLNESLAGAVFSPEDVAEAGDEAIAETQKQLNTLKNARAGYQLSINTIDANAQKERNAEADKTAKENQDRLNAETANLQKALADRTEAERSFNEKRLTELRDAELANFKGTEEEKIALKQKYDTQLAELALANQRARLDEQREAELAGETLTQDAIDAINQKYRLLNEEADIEYTARLRGIDNEATDATLANNQKIKDDNKAKWEAGFVLAQDTLNATIALIEAFGGDNEKLQKRAFQIQKSLGIANTIISTIEGASNAYKTAQGSPLTAVFPAYPFIQAGLATAFGIAKVKQIASTTFESKTPKGGGSAGGGGGAGGQGGVLPRAITSATISTGAPNVTLPTQQGGVNGGQEAQPIKAYVLASDVVSSVDAREQINKRRTL